MKGYMLTNFLDPIAKVWGNIQPSYPPSFLRTKRPKQKNRGKDLNKRLPK